MTASRFETNVPADETAEHHLLAVALRGEIRPAELGVDARWFSAPLHRAAWAVLLVLDEAPCRATHEPLRYAPRGRPLVRLAVLARLVLGLVGAPLVPAATWWPDVVCYLAYHRDHWAAEGHQASAARVQELHRQRWMIARLQTLIGGWLWGDPPADGVLRQTATRLEQMTVDGDISA